LKLVAAFKRCSAPQIYRVMAWHGKVLRKAFNRFVRGFVNFGSAPPGGALRPVDEAAAFLLGKKSILCQRAFGQINFHSFLIRAISSMRVLRVSGSADRGIPSRTVRIDVAPLHNGTFTCGFELYQAVCVSRYLSALWSFVPHSPMYWQPVGANRQ
jgi:hypothetical protein